MQYILHVDYMQYRRQPMNEIKYSTVVSDTLLEERE